MSTHLNTSSRHLLASNMPGSEITGDDRLSLNFKLYQQIISDEESRRGLIEQFIVQNTGLVNSLARGMGEPSLKNDLKSEGYLALTQAIQAIARRQTPLANQQDLIRYLSSTIRRALTAFIANRNIGPSHSTKKRKRKNQRAGIGLDELNEVIGPLYLRLRSGDWSAENEMFESCDQIARLAIERHLEERPNEPRERLELESIAAVSLRDGVHKLSLAHDWHPRKIGGVTSYALTYRLEDIKTSLFDRIMSALKGNQKKTLSLESDIADPNYENRYCCDYRVGQDAPQLLEMIEKCCKSNLESDVARLRGAGESDIEIASQLKVDRMVVTRTRKRIETRFDEQCQTLGA